MRKINKIQYQEQLNCFRIIKIFFYNNYIKFWYGKAKEIRLKDVNKHTHDKHKILKKVKLKLKYIFILNILFKKNFF